MAIGGLFGALKVIPWKDVVTAAPAVVRGAQQLWNKVRHEAPPPEAAAAVRPAPAAGPAASDPQAALDALDARVQALDSRLAQQAREAAAASELIAALAEQNARLIETVGRLRRQALALAVAAAVLGAGVAAALAVALAGR